MQNPEFFATRIFIARITLGCLFRRHSIHLALEKFSMSSFCLTQVSGLIRKGRYRMNDGGLRPIDFAQLLRSLNDSPRIDAIPGPEDLRSAVLDKGVPDAYTLYGESGEAGVAQAFQNRTAESSLEHVFFNGHDFRYFSGKARKQLGVHGFDKPAVHYGCPYSLLFQLDAGLERLLNRPADAQNVDIAALLHNLGRPDRHIPQAFVKTDSDTTASGIANRDRAAVIDGRLQHVPQFILIPGGHDHHVGQAAKIRQVKETLMSWTIFSNDATPVDGENHRKGFQADIV
jgi:hypothetical protein